MKTLAAFLTAAIVATCLPSCQTTTTLPDGTKIQGYDPAATAAALEAARLALEALAREKAVHAEK